MTLRSLLRPAALGLALTFLAAGAANAEETWTARAELKTADGKILTAPVTISLDRMLTTAERDTLLAAFKSADAAALKKALAAQATLGYVEGGNKVKVPVKFAFPRSTGGGKIVTIVCNEPIVFIGGDVPDSKPKAGYDFAYVLLDPRRRRQGDRRGGSRREIEVPRRRRPRHRGLRRRHGLAEGRRPEVDRTDRSRPGVP